MTTVPTPHHADAPPIRPRHPRDVPRWVAPIVIVGALLTATGAVTALLASGEGLNADVLNTAGRDDADYFVTRNLAMAAMLIVTLVLRDRRALAALMTLTALIQLLDAVAAALTARVGLIPIDLAFAAVFLLGACQLSGRQLWHRTSRHG